MANVYVEPRPKARAEHEPIACYVLEHANDAPVAGAQPSYQTQALAVADAKRLGYQPLVARVRVTDKGNPDHWRAA
jgi:hypothetical protein